MRNKRAVLLLVCFPVVAVLPSCGGRDPNLPELFPVKGTVTLEGKPLSGAVVSFIPVGDTRGTGARGYTDQHGHYELKSRHLGTGAAVGGYRVTIAKLMMPDGSDFPVDADISPTESGAKQVLPQKYSADHQTTLGATIPDGGAVVDFALELTP